jgi:hypothetical protein
MGEQIKDVVATQHNKKIIISKELKQCSYSLNLPVCRRVYITDSSPKGNTIYRMFQKELYNFESVHEFIHRTCAVSQCSKPHRVLPGAVMVNDSPQEKIQECKIRGTCGHAIGAALPIHRLGKRVLRYSSTSQR